ncbi:MAG: hypothetical protein LBH75_00440 [Treponema sp.]|nr:hypothetical protein [Treponema sp.]
MSDWYPLSRDGQIHMVETWLAVFKTKAADWGIPASNVTDLAAALTAAKEKLALVKSGERTAVSVVECNEVFKEMETEARFIKRHWLLVPPLAAADLASLLLSQEDDSRTPIGKPTGQPSVIVTYPGGPHLLKVHLTFLAGTQPLDVRSDYGYALYRGIMPQGGATLEQAASAKHYLMKPPLDGEELIHYRFTRRKTENVSFSAEESGMMAYFCARYENGKGEEGQWGPVASAVIP